MRPLPVSHLSELVLESEDLAASRRFYGELLGLEETRKGEFREDRRWFLIGETGRLGLWTPQVGLAGGRGGSHVHFAMHVDESDLVAVMERFEAEGIEYEGPIQLGPGRAVYLTDPDGNVVELWTQDMVEYAADA